MTKNLTDTITGGKGFVSSWFQGDSRPSQWRRQDGTAAPSMTMGVKGRADVHSAADQAGTRGQAKSLTSLPPPSLARPYLLRASELSRWQQLKLRRGIQNTNLYRTVQIQTVTFHLGPNVSYSSHDVECI